MMFQLTDLTTIALYINGQVRIPIRAFFIFLTANQAENFPLAKTDSLFRDDYSTLDSIQKHKLNALVVDFLEKDKAHLHFFIKNHYWTIVPELAELDASLEKRFQTLIKQFFDENINERYRIHEIAPYYRCIRTLNLPLMSEIKKIDNQIGGRTFYPELLLDLSSLEVTNDIEEKLLCFLKKHSKTRCDFELKLQCRIEHSLESMVATAKLISRLPWPRNIRITLQADNVNNGNPPKVVAFMRHLRNQAITMCDLSSNGLGTMDSPAFLNFMRDLSEQYFGVVLHDNQLNRFHLETIHSCVSLLDATKSKGFCLSNNQLETLGCDNLFKLHEQYKTLPFTFFSVATLCPDDGKKNLMDAVELACKDASIETQCLWAFMYYKALILSFALRQSYATTPTLFRFNLTSQKNIEILYRLFENSFVPSEGDHYRLCFLLHTILTNINLTSFDLLLFARKILGLTQKSNTPPYSVLSLFHSGSSSICDQMTPEHRIAFFLDIFSEDLERKMLSFSSIFQDFSIFESAHPSSAIVRTLEGVYRKNVQEFQLFDEETVKERLWSMVLPALKLVLEKRSMPIEAMHLVASIEKYRAQHPGSDGMLPTANMIEWLVWACAKLTLYPAPYQESAQDSHLRHTLILNDTENVLNVHTQEQIQANTQEFGIPLQPLTAAPPGDIRLPEGVKIHKPSKHPNRALTSALTEILAFAHPQGRYKLTTELFNHLSDYSTDLASAPYIQINQDGSKPTLLVSIPLVAIINPMMRDPELSPEQKSTIIKRTKAIIDLMPLAQGPGRHYRTIVNTLLLLSNDETLQPQEKLHLIEQSLHRGVLIKMDRLIKLLNNPTGESEYLNIWNALHSTHPKLTEALENNMGLSLAFRVLPNREHQKLLAQYQKKFRQGLIQQRFKDLKTSDFKRLLADLILLQGLSTLGKLPAIYGAGNHFESQCRAIFKELFDLADHHFEHYAHTVVDYRNSAGLITYYSKMLSLHSEIGQAVLTSFKQFVKALLSENHQDFYALRHNIQDNSHLRPLFAARPDLEIKWHQGACHDFESFIKKHAIAYKQYQPDLRTFLKKKIFGHHHVDPKHYQRLNEYLEAASIEAKAQARQQALAYLASSEQQALSMQSEGDELRHAKIQVALIELLETPLDHEHVSTHHYEPVLKILRNTQSMLHSLGQRPPFLHDIQGLIAGLKSNFYPPKQHDFKDWRIIDTDHPWALFMAGTDVEGSCQAVDGDPSLNQCLMGYVMDPKNRLLAIQNPEDLTMARCILRLLVDDQNNPVLFMEEIYPDNVRSDFKDALKQMALHRAQALDLPLLALESTPESYAYGQDVHSRYSPAPTEYVDALYGDQENGEFDIPNPQCLFDPRLQLRAQRQADDNLASAHVPPCPKPQFLTFEWEVWQRQYHETWQKRYHERYPQRESQGYGPGAMIVRG